ncbi:MAG TPA: CDP-alcohol phosphatidyltransferase family protein, partial [Bacilli bacterium]
WIVTVIIAREFMVTGIRLLAANNNIVIAASKLGKAKTISQIVAIIALLINGFPFVLISTEVANIVCLVLTYIAALMTIVSGVDYFVKNRKIIFKSY